MYKQLAEAFSWPLDTISRMSPAKQALLYVNVQHKKSTNRSDAKLNEVLERLGYKK